MPQPQTSKMSSTSTRDWNTAINSDVMTIVTLYQEIVAQFDSHTCISKRRHIWSGHSIIPNIMIQWTPADCIWSDNEFNDTEIEVGRKYRPF